MFLAETAILAELKLVRSIALVFCGGVVSLLALGASEGDDVSHFTILDTLPPSPAGEPLECQ